MSADRAELYRCRTPEGLRVPLLVHPEAIKDDIPAEAEIRMNMAVQGLKIGRLGGGIEHTCGEYEGVDKEWLQTQMRKIN